MSDAGTPPSVSGGETVSAGMHLSGGSHAEAQAGMRFLDPGALQVDFVDLSAAETGTSNAGPISFAEWQAGGATVPAAAAGFDAARYQGSGAMLTDLTTGTSIGVPGGAMQPSGNAAWVGPLHFVP